MEVKNLLDPEVKQEMIDRINRLRPASQRKWGSMDVSQMLAHCQKPIQVALGQHIPKGSFLLRVFGPMFKSSLYNDRPYSRNLPTDKTFKITSSKDFEKEKSALVNLINNFTEDNIIKGPHPIFGKLTRDQWSLSMWKHTDHHLHQFGV